MLVFSSFPLYLLSLAQVSSRDMKAGGWLIAMATAPCGRNRASAVAASAKSFVYPTRTASRIRPPVDLRRCSSASRVPSRSSRSTSSMRTGSGGADGESWCGHELLNTVTTDWVEDHLGDPEVCQLFMLNVTGLSFLDVLSSVVLLSRRQPLVNMTT